MTMMRQSHGDYSSWHSPILLKILQWISCSVSDLQTAQNHTRTYGAQNAAPARLNFTASRKMASRCCHKRIVSGCCEMIARGGDGDQEDQGAEGISNGPTQTSHERLNWTENDRVLKILAQRPDTF
jgi:hypothetical protein